MGPAAEVVSPQDSPLCPSGHRQGHVPGSQVLQWPENHPRAKQGGNQIIKPSQSCPWALATALQGTVGREGKKESILVLYLIVFYKETLCYRVSKSILNNCWEMQTSVWTRVWCLREFPAALGAAPPGHSRFQGIAKLSFCLFQISFSIRTRNEVEVVRVKGWTVSLWLLWLD